MNRRRIARACIVIGFLCLAGEAIAAIVPGHHVRALGFTTALSAIGGGLTYLRSTGRAAVNRLDREQWRCARTFADIGELTALWLEGYVASVPGYCGPPDEETKELIPVLAKLNRAGFVTTGSQPAFDARGYDGARWRQRVAVEGFAGPEMTPALIAAANDTGLTVVVRDPAALPRWRYRYDRSVTVTTREGERYTAFGVQLPRRHIRDGWLGYGICHRDAAGTLCAAWQVTVIDPEWGRPDVLWRVLEQAIQPAGGTS